MTKKLKTSIFAIALSTLAVGSFSCKNSSLDGNRVGESSSAISSVPFSFSMKTAKKAYEITNSEYGGKYYLSIDASVAWPETIGDYDLKPLQDTILSMLDKQRPASIDSAMMFYVGDAKSYELGDKIKEVASVPQMTEANNSFYSTMLVNIDEITDEYINYECQFEQYTGGAHPMHGSTPFTYLLKQGKIVSLKWLFKNSESPELLKAVKDAVLQSTNLSEREFNEMTFTAQLPLPENVYIEDGMIVFHYNPYAILPYAYGSVDAPVSPYIVESLLTPEAKALLIAE